MPVMHKKIGVFQKLAPLWAVLLCALNVGAAFLYLFVVKETDDIDTYHSFIRFAVLIFAVLISTLSFAAEDDQAVVKHVTFYIVSSALFVGAVYLYAVKVFPDSSGLTQAELTFREFIMGESVNNLSADKEEYAQFAVKYAGILSLYLCGGVAAFSAAKLYLSSNGWIKRDYK